MGITTAIVISFILTVQIASSSVVKAYSMMNIFELKDTNALSVEDQVIICVIAICNGTDHDDIIIGSPLSETIYGFNGNDNIQGNGGEDVINGGLGDDTIQGGSALDKLFGQNGNDHLYADSSSSSTSSLTENNNSLATNEMSIDLNSSSKVSPNEILNNNSLTDGYIGGADIFSSLLPNILDLQQSFLDGGTGDDHLYGGSGDDILLGGPGHDFFDCGEGTDQILDFDLKVDTMNTNCEII